MLKSEAKDAFKELERETKGGDSKTREKIDKGIENISLKIAILPESEGNLR